MTIMIVICCCYIVMLCCTFVSSEARVFFLPDKTHQILAEGDTINITCVYQSDGVPSDELKLTRNGQDLKGFQFTQKGSISAPWNKTTNGLKANASCEDDGQYICSYGPDKSFQNISIIRVVHSNSTLSHSGGDVVLQCEPKECSGANLFTKEVSWSHDGKSLKADAKYNITQSGSMVIKNADYSDLGPYECEIVLHNGGEDDDEFILNVYLQGPPKVTIEGNKEIYVCENQSFEVLCKTEGFPKPDVEWQASLENASEETHNLTKGNRLTFVTFQSVHQGNYTCVATSSMFPQVKVKDSIRISLDRKRPCGSVTEASILPIIIAVSVVCLILVVGFVALIVVCLRRKGICKQSDEQLQSSSNENEAGSSRGGIIPLALKSSENQHYSADEPLLQDKTTNKTSVTATLPPPKPPRTFSF